MSSRRGRDDGEATKMEEAPDKKKIKKEHQEDPKSSGEEVARDQGCRLCDNNPCDADEVRPLLMAIHAIHSGMKTNKEVRFLMYREACRFFHGPGLGRGVRKRQCL